MQCNTSVAIVLLSSSTSSLWFDSVAAYVKHIRIGLLVSESVRSAGLSSSITRKSPPLSMLGCIAVTTYDLEAWANCDQSAKWAASSWQGDPLPWPIFPLRNDRRMAQNRVLDADEDAMDTGSLELWHIFIMIDRIYSIFALQEGNVRPLISYAIHSHGRCYVASQQFDFIADRNSPYKLLRYSSDEKYFCNTCSLRVIQQNIHMYNRVQYRGQALRIGCQTLNNNKSGLTFF